MENIHIIVGNLGADPEISYLPDNTAKLTFSVATTESWTDKDTGEYKDSTQWHNVEVWGKRGEHYAKKLTCGCLVYVKGPHLSETWEDKNDGRKRSRHFIKAQKVRLLAKKS